jgi:hypothetical protein
MASVGAQWPQRVAEMCEGVCGSRWEQAGGRGQIGFH